MRACVLSPQSCLTLCNPMDHSSPGFSVHGILQASILQWVAMSSSRGSVFCGSCIAGRFLTHWTTWEAWTHEYLLQIPLLANDHSCPRIYSSAYRAINPSHFETCISNCRYPYTVPTYLIISIAVCSFFWFQYCLQHEGIRISMNFLEFLWHSLLFSSCQGLFMVSQFLSFITVGFPRCPGILGCLFIY